MASLGVFAFVWFQRRDVTAPSIKMLLMELLGVALLTISGLLGGSLVLEGQVGVAEHTASGDRGKDRSPMAV